MADRPIAEVCTCAAHNIHKWQISLSSRDSNSQLQYASGHKLTI